jgi:hypothetical protein
MKKICVDSKVDMQSSFWSFYFLNGSLVVPLVLQINFDSKLKFFLFLTSWKKGQRKSPGYGGKEKQIVYWHIIKNLVFGVNEFHSTKKVLPR